MIKVNNFNISDIYYSGYTIIRAYGCGGEQVYNSYPVPYGTRYILYLNDDTTVTGSCTVNGQPYHQIDGNWVHSAETDRFNTDDDLSAVTSVALGECATALNIGAFSGFTNMSAITVSNNLVDIGQGAFSNCYSLENFPYSESLEHIYDSAFYKCYSLTSVTIPSSIQSIGAYAFEGCSGLTSVTMEGTTPPTLGSYAFYDEFSQTKLPIKIYVPAASLQAYKTATNWSDYADRIYPIGYVPSYDEDEYFKFVAEANNFTVSFTYGSTNRIEYSVDSGQTWITLTSSNNTTSAVNSGQTIWFKASGLTADSNNGIGTLLPSANASVRGNIMSLVYGDDFNERSTKASYLMANYQFVRLFDYCTNLTSAEHLGLPATTLSSGCYKQMFRGCTSLTAAPELPATTLAEHCYQYMFLNCTNLTTAPELPATTLANYCYGNMFNGCTSLNYIKCLATDISATNSRVNWVSGVASTGTFVKAASMNDWTTGLDGIPYGWTVQNDGGDTPTPPAPSYDTQYLTTESLEDGNTISFTMGTGMTTAITTAVTSVSVSTDDGVTWTSMENIGAGASLSVTLDTGEKAIWKGDALGYSIATASTKSTSFSSTGLYKVYGNILSLLYDDDFINQNNPTLPNFNCFANLFYGSRDLIDASNLFMRFNLDNNTKRPLGYLFRGCINLIAAPELGNIDFGNSQYAFRDMFHDCESLTTAPALTATTLAIGCYNYMFQGCTGLTTAPELPATTLAESCYRQMFYNCSNLNYIKCLATDISASNSRANWVFGVASTGTFVKAASMNDWTTGTAGIPTGWTVQNDDGDAPIDPGDAD